MTTFRKIHPSVALTVTQTRAEEVWRRLIQIEAVEAYTGHRADFQRDTALLDEFSMLAESLGYRVEKIEPVKEAAE